MLFGQAPNCCPSFVFTTALLMLHTQELGPLLQLPPQGNNKYFCDSVHGLKSQDFIDYPTAQFCAVIHSTMPLLPLVYSYKLPSTSLGS